MHTHASFNLMGADHLPGLLGIAVTHIGVRELRVEMRVQRSVMASNGYLHAGTVVTLADTAAGYGCIANLPESASGFTTIVQDTIIGPMLNEFVAMTATRPLSLRTNFPPINSL